jgi:hypothetical protein
MKKVFKEIQSRLVSLHEIAPQGNALKRINTLSGLVSGMIRKGSSHLPDIGSGLPKNIDANSKTTAAKRFIDNKWTDYEVHFLPFLLAFIRGIVLTTSCINQGMTLVIDGSQMGKDNAVLMISIVWGGRGIPICWVVKSGGKGHFKVEDHMKVLEKALEILKAVFPPDTRVTLLGDGEFDAIEIQELCLANNWDYVLRTACNTVLFEEGEQFKARTVSPEKTHDVYFIPKVEFTQKRFRYVNFVCWHDQKRHEEPIYLISNLPCAGEIIEYYNRRYSIECLFKDMKSTSFNLHKTRLKKPQEINNLMIIAALAFILLTVLAVQYDEPQWRKRVQRVRGDRKVLSFFTFAYKLIDYFTDNDICFNFSFQFSKNIMNPIQDST